MGDLGDSKKTQNPGALLAAMSPSQAAFVIENPQKAKDNRANNLPGVTAHSTPTRASEAKTQVIKQSGWMSLISSGATENWPMR